jgi:hypothetical protein
MLRTRRFSSSNDFLKPETAFSHFTAYATPLELWGFRKEVYPGKLGRLATWALVYFAKPTHFRLPKTFYPQKGLAFVFQKFLETIRDWRLRLKSFLTLSATPGSG